MAGNMGAFEQELLANLAHIEELTDQQIISILKNILTAVGTGYNIDAVNSLYQHFYEELETRFASDGKPNPNPYADLWQFYEYWGREGLSTYSSRRAYVAGLYRDNSVKDDSIWALVNPDITAVARSRYNSGHYADAVEASYKEINSRVKALVKQKKGKEYDGSDLMNHAFSIVDPVITLDDLSTEDGKNIQKGYMQIFSGAMTGVRNPKAHSNAVLEPQECMHLLYLASHLLNKIESAVKPVINDEINDTKTKDERIFIRLMDSSDNSATLVSLRQVMLDNSDPHGTDVILVIGTSPTLQAIRLPYQVKKNRKVIEAFKEIIGAENVKVQ